MPASVPSPEPSRRLRVGLDAWVFGGAAGGVSRYVEELTHALAALPDAPDLVAVDPAPSLRLPPSLQSVHARWGSRTTLGRQALGVPLVVRRLGLDVFHAPAYIGPLWGAVPVALTLHDVSYARQPAWYPYRRDPVRRAWYRMAARRASVILTDSVFSHDEILAAYRLPPERVRVVPLGVSPRFSPGPGTVAGSALDPGTAAPYVLHVGAIHLRRNLGVALEAVLALRREAGSARALRLVLVGPDHGGGRELLARADAAQDARAVEWLPHVTDERLVALYRGAVALVYPSRYEGFGLPVLEAMACGTPVVAARAGALPEVVGGAGVLLDPGDADGFRVALARLCEDADEGARLRALGLERAARFSWARTARETLSAYCACLA